MLKFKLYRKENNNRYCQGRLYISSEEGVTDNARENALGECFICDTLEPPVRPAGVRVRGRTAVPAGTYGLIVNKSHRFGRLLPLLVGVPGMVGVRIHRGNTAADTAGCILPGFYIGHGRLNSSTPREVDITTLLLDNASQGAEIEIVDDFPDSELATDFDSPVASPEAAKPAAAPKAAPAAKPTSLSYISAANTSRPDTYHGEPIATDRLPVSYSSIEDDRQPFAFATQPLERLVPQKVWKQLTVNS